MTPEQFLEKFPNPHRNENCLEDIACPHCGERDEFKIQATSFFSVHDDGTEGYEDTEWDDKSPCECTSCRNCGRVAEFTVEGLDDLILERKADA